MNSSSPEQGNAFCFVFCIGWPVSSKREGLALMESAVTTQAGAAGCTIAAQLYTTECHMMSGNGETESTSKGLKRLN